MSHESYDLPARGIPLNEGTVLSFSPNEEPSTTDSILSEGLCKTEPSCSTRHRTMSQMSDGYRISPEAAPLRRVLPTLLQAANPSMWSFSFCKRLSGIKTGRYTFSTRVFKTLFKIRLNIFPYCISVRKIVQTSLYA